MNTHPSVNTKQCVWCTCVRVGVCVVCVRRVYVFHVQYRTLDLVTKKPTREICLNDGLLGKPTPWTEAILDEVQHFLRKMFPEKSPWEF